MKFDRSNIRAAIAMHLSPQLAARLDLAAGVDDCELAQVLGAAIIAAVAPGAGVNVGLTQVLVSVEGGDRSLSPEEVAAYPLIREWAVPSLAEAVGLPFSAGATFAIPVTALPDLGTVQIIDQVGGVLGGVAQTTLRDATTEARFTAIYGQVTARPSFGTYTAFDARALFMAGQTARALQAGGRASKSAMLAPAVGAARLH